MKMLLAPFEAKVLKDWIKIINTQEGKKEQRMLTLYITKEDQEQIIKSKVYATYADGQDLTDTVIVINTMTISPYEFNGKTGISYNIESFVTGLPKENNVTENGL